MKFAPLFRATLLVSAVALLPASTAGLAAVDGRSSAQFGKLLAIYQLVKENYVDQVDDEKLFRGAINGMLESLDPHSSYLDAGGAARDLAAKGLGSWGRAHHQLFDEPRDRGRWTNGGCRVR